MAHQRVAASDQEYCRQLAERELETARQWLTLCPWYSAGFINSKPEQMLRAKILGHAMRAAHLDPTKEEAARLVALGIDCPYWLRGEGRSSACYDRIMAEAQRYMERFGRSSEAGKVKLHYSGAASDRLDELRSGGGWMDKAYNPEIYRCGQIAMMGLDRDIHDRIEMNLWYRANLVGQTILGHCPLGMP